MCKLFPFSRGNARIPTSLLLKSTNFAHRNFVEKELSSSYKWRVLTQACALLRNKTDRKQETFPKWQDGPMLKAFRSQLGVSVSRSSQTDVCRQAEWWWSDGNWANLLLEVLVWGICGKLNICTVRCCSWWSLSVKCKKLFKKVRGWDAFLRYFSVPRTQIYIIVICEGVICLVC